MNRSTKLIIDDIREVLQLSSPDIPSEDGVIERTLQDLAKVEKRHKKLLEAVEKVMAFEDYCITTASEQFNTEAEKAFKLLRNAINKAKGGKE